MDFAYTEADEAFRTELITWLDEKLPKFLADWSEDDSPEAEADSTGGAGSGGVMSQMERRRAWQRKLNEGRWAAISWPMNGAAASHRHAERRLLRDDGPLPHTGHLQRQRPLADRSDDHPVGHRGAEARVAARTSSTPIDHWCQGFTEPEAGSDLANLRTLAVRDGDDYVAERAEDLDLDRAHRQLGPVPACAPIRPPSRRSASTRASPR